MTRESSKMSETYSIALSYLCMSIGLGATIAYAATFFVTPFNELDITIQDTPYVLSMVECVVASSTLILGILAFAHQKTPPKRVALVTLIYFATALLFEAACVTTRAWHFGMFGDDMLHTCSDAGALTGCPTSRYELLEDRDISHSSECTFWFWGPNMFTRGDADCNVLPPISVTPTGDCKEVMDTYMDWSHPTSYGLRDDPTSVTTASFGELSTPDQVNSMRKLMELQAKLNGTIQQPLTSQPSINYCWYWGCNSVCHEHRFRVNWWWFISSASLLVLYGINVTLTAIVWRHHTGIVKKEDGASVDVETANGEEMFIVPTIGRRKRNMKRNPDMLRF